MSRANQWFVLGDGIAREVITADIQRYLGPDALVRPGTGSGEYQGQPGYWITAYRTLTSQMIQDLKMDSQRWQQERQPGEGRGVYQDSRTHAARQHWGPSKPVEHPSAVDPYDRQPAPRASSAYATSAAYAPSDSHYTTAPAGYGSSQSGYQAAPSSAAPRTQPADPYGGYSQRDQGYQSQAYGSYQSQSPVDSYGRPTAAPTAYATPSATPAPRLLHCIRWSTVPVIPTTTTVISELTTWIPETLGGPLFDDYAATGGSLPGVASHQSLFHRHVLCPEIPFCFPEFTWI